MSSFSGFNISCDILYLSTEGPVELGALVVHDAGDLWGLGGRVPPVRTTAKANCGATCCKMMNFRAVHPTNGKALLSEVLPLALFINSRAPNGAQSCCHPLQCHAALLPFLEHLECAWCCVTAGIPGRSMVGSPWVSVNEGPPCADNKRTNRTWSAR